MRAARLSLVFCALVAFAQFPGQYPGQSPLPGGYPGGTPYPTGGRRPQQQQPPQDSGRQSSSRQRSVAAITTEGVLRRASSNQVVIEPEDHRVIWYRLTDKTTIQKDGRDADVKSFQVADHLTVDSTEDDQGNFIATAIAWNKAGTREEQAQASRTWDLPAPSTGPLARASTTQASRGGDDDRPILRRKKEDSVPQAQAPAPQPTSAPPPASTPAPVAVNDEPVDTRPATTVRPPDPAQDSDDPGKPVLRRGTPATRPAPAAASNASSSTTAASAGNAPVLTARSTEPSLSRPGQPDGREVSQPIPIQDDPVIQKARDMAASFAGVLPNFFCQQSTTRYQTDNPKRGWDAIDIVTADVAYENGRETYKNIKIGNKVVGQSMDELPGTRSTGEFATQLEVLMHPGTGAIFRKNGQDSIRGRQAWVYKFDIPRERANWRIEGNSQLFYPAYRGSVWIDKETSRVLRIEQEAHNLPPLFQFDTVESSTDYDFVRLGTPEQYLLPVEAEVLSCERGTSNCSRNKMEFRNYRKFGAESSITFGDSTK